ncbi:putative S-locus-specific glycoprotein/EP1 [Helianthus annuus]|uniref:S-locus-specific glycoprotein/EP1 n=2 Tax=Helianthus annuus TaxID=4232 RepID=A0A9K3MZD6_HELAN|nr:epidermis-specific secreted glycoprotein EP1 [Helianthus annuus]KAF5780818.1 putative S-locus-specific glycoprotein/EP1 [Helianthus annuus]KAJ0500528.1 putative S-locus-specific glycoprotein/EP1 [Helianthus annuus]KAJ0516403.1 putative S-locus-specific glycoprotein/EP1 [Helianthus annuus]KAJ0684407.1 putative S-locus-specific glycoprotein/EP1 [Helianthus annuus]KAJ0869480.1 putative S-locus-specific glycoprotein/EP1 [Helianthus annuus]
MAAYSSSLSSIFICFLFGAFLISEAVVPANETFRYVNQGDLSFGNDYLDFVSEYAPTYRPLPPFTFPFQLCFYNTTPNAYTLGLRMGTIRSQSVMRWVWEANRGKPVRENATFSLGSDGNLILAEADGQIVWQTNTANKGVVGFAILPDGNVVLRDSRGNFVWQSFDYPTDTLLIGQSLRVRGGPYKLVSRASVTNNVEGDYSFVIEPKRLALYYKNNMRYWSSTFPELNRENVTIVNATLVIQETEYEENNFNALRCNLQNGQSFEFPTLDLGQVQYNSSLSYLRLGIDGNLRLYTYRANVRGNAVWTLLYTLFDRREDEGGMIFEDECQLPNRCGNFGLCEDSQCVGCPTPNGVFAWSKDCNTKSPGCNASGFKYYQLKGVNHFTVKYTAGTEPVKQSDCESNCTKDCNCMGYFYHTDNSRCWIAYELKTLTRVGNSTSLAYIKTPVT